MLVGVSVRSGGSLKKKGQHLVQSILQTPHNVNLHERAVLVTAQITV